MNDLIQWFATDLFLWAKWVHVVSATVLFGTGLGTAVHMWLAHRSGNVQAIATVARNVVFADWAFTAPSGVIQPASGAVLIWLGGHSPMESWLIVAYALYGVAAFCWFFVVWIQIRVRNIARDAMGHALPREYYAFMRTWFLLGWPAFLGLLGVFFLMVWRPALW